MPFIAKLPLVLIGIELRRQTSPRGQTHRSVWPRHARATGASMPMSTRGSFAIKGIKSCRDTRLRNTTCRLLMPTGRENRLCDIDPEDFHLLLLGLAPVAQWFTALELIVAHCSHPTGAAISLLTSPGDTVIRV